MPFYDIYRASNNQRIHACSTTFTSPVSRASKGVYSREEVHCADRSQEQVVTGAFIFVADRLPARAVDQVRIHVDLEVAPGNDRFKVKIG